MSWIHGSSSRLAKREWRYQKKSLFDPPGSSFGQWLASNSTCRIIITSRMQEPQRIATNLGWRKSPPLVDGHHVASIVYPLWLVEHELFDIGLSPSGRPRPTRPQLEPVVTVRLHCQLERVEKVLPGLVVDTIVDLSRPVRFESGPRPRDVHIQGCFVKCLLALWEGGELSGVVFSSPVASRCTMS